MIRFLMKTVRNNGAVVGIMIPFLDFTSRDKITVGQVEEDPNDNGWERLRKMFEIDEFGDMSKEMYSISQTAMMSSFIGVLVGGIIHSRTAYENFMRHNTASKFSSHLEAKKKLQDAIVQSFGQGAFKWGWRITLFSTSFIGIGTMVSTYRGKDGILEYVIAGGATGAMYKWQMGPRGWIAGGVIGTALGIFTGCFTYGLLELTGMSMSDLRNFQKSVSSFRRAYIEEGLKKQQEEEDTLLKSHNQKFSQNKEDILKDL